ncbi:MAG TPA: PilN domain-containing protein [Gammaproteobacteria bacterium]|nr:PilN domain-containing protein [Gammaproteobacteria bacterium]
MKQQINLFQSQFRKQRRLLTAAFMTRMLLVLAGALAGVYGWQFWETRMLQVQLIDLQNQAQAVKQKLAETQAKFPERQKDKRLEEELQQLQKELDDDQYVVQALQAGDYGDRNGFSPYFEALSRQHVEGTWLRRIEITEGGRQIGLEGHALEPELVPLYVQRLSQERIFNGKSFSELELKRPADQTAVRVDFSLFTQSHAAQGGKKNG